MDKRVVSNDVGRDQQRSNLSKKLEGFVEAAGLAQGFDEEIQKKGVHGMAGFDDETDDGEGKLRVVGEGETVDERCEG